MAKQQLSTDFKDDILGYNMGGKRRYRMIQNSDGTVSFEDVTNYTQIGSNFGSKQVNETNLAVNNSVDKAHVIDNLGDVISNVTTGKVAGALSLRELSNKLFVKYDTDREILTPDYYRGKPVYLKIVSTGIPNNGTVSYVTNIPPVSDIWIDASMSCFILSTGNCPVPYIDEEGYFIRAMVNRTSRNIEITDNWNYSQFSGRIAVKYTKA